MLVESYSLHGKIGNLEIGKKCYCWELVNSC